MNHSLVFKNTTFDVVTRDGDTWLRSQQISVALGYSRGDQVTDLYQRHADEFTDDMTALVKLPSEGGEQDARIFSPRGCYALAMFSRTKEAKAFRRWVLDVLESIRKTGKYETPYSVGKTDTLAKDEQDYLRGLVKAHVETLPKEQQGGAAIKMWSKLKSHFGVAYRDIPRHEFAEAVSLLTRATLPDPTAALSLPELFASKRWLVHMTAEGHLVWNEMQPDMVILPMSDMTQAIGKAWWGCVDTLADLNRICGKTGQKFDIPRRAA